MELLEKLKGNSYQLESIPWLKEAYAFDLGSGRVNLLLVTGHPLSPREKHEGKKKVKDIFWEISVPFDFRIVTKNDLAHQLSRGQGLTNVFDSEPVLLFRKSF